MGLAFRIRGLGLRMNELRSGILGLWFRIKGSGFRMKGLGAWYVWDLWFRIEGSGMKVTLKV